MPKVNQDYFDNKKMQILDAAYKIFQNKPLYEMTMLDVIKEAGLSKGGIYRYFSDIDDVIIALINRETAQNNNKPKIDDILASTTTTAEAIEKLFAFLGTYIKESPAILGKFQFELTVYMANHPEKSEKFKSNLTEQENGQYLVRAIFNKILEGVEKGELKPAFSLNDIFTYTISSIDGAVNKAVMERCYGDNAGSFNAVIILKILSKSVLHMLGVNG